MMQISWGLLLLAYITEQPSPGIGPLPVQRAGSSLFSVE
jgi:hypothetical protein